LLKKKKRKKKEAILVGKNDIYFNKHLRNKYTVQEVNNRDTEKKKETKEKS
jgi:hypothetical protein